MSHSPLSLIFGFLMYLNPFSKGLSRTEGLVYCSRRQGPTGLWEKLSELHYFLFNRGKKHLLKTDVELQAGKVNTSNKAIILITDDAMGQVAGLDLKEWVTMLRADWNVMLIHLHESPRNILVWTDVVTVGPLERGDLPEVVKLEVESLKQRVPVDAVIAMSLESGEVLKPLRDSGIPILHVIPEFMGSPRQVIRLKKSRRDATLQLFPDASWRKRAADKMEIDSDQRMIVLGDVPAPQLSGKMQDLVGKAFTLLEEEKRQIGEVLSSGIFDRQYAVPEISDNRVAAASYLAAWRSGWKPRKPRPGFHPGVFRDHHPNMQGDPTVEFILRGQPSGPWLTEAMGEKEGSDSDREYIAVGTAWIDPATAGLQRGELSGRERVKVNGIRKTIRAALHLHLHYTDGIEGLLRKIGASQSKPDLFISVTSKDGEARVTEALEKNGLKALGVAIFPNRGRDIGPFLTGFGPKLFSEYEIVGHLHSKKSPHAHDDYLRNWVEFLEEGLVGKDGGMMGSILAKMESDPSIGIVYPDDPGCFGWEGNFSHGVQLLEKMGFEPTNQYASMNFPVGTMFWARTAALKPLIDLNLKWEDFPEEPVAIDGTMLHAMERLIGVVPGLVGYRTVVTAVNGIAR